VDEGNRRKSTKTIVKKDPKIWEWQVIQVRKVIAGGYGRTKKDATNDLNVWLRPNAGTQRPGTPDGSLATDLRYEAIRRMSPRTFGEIHRLNLSGRIFDDLVDEALKAWKWPQEHNVRMSDGL